MSGTDRTAEWSTRELRDAVYASPSFTRLLDAAALKDTIAKGVQQGLFGYAAQGEAGYVSAAFQETLDPEGVEFSDDVVLLPPDRAREVKVAATTIESPVSPGEAAVPPVTVGPGGW